MYCNAPTLTFTQGQAVRFHILALGTEGEPLGGCPEVAAARLPAEPLPHPAAATPPLLLLTPAAAPAHLASLPVFSVDMHTPNFVGQSLTADEQRGAAIG